MSKRLLIAASAALMMACAKPQVAPSPKTPLRVAVTFSEDRPDRADMEHRWAEALRDRLAHLGSVRSEGAEAQPGDAELHIRVYAVATRGDVVKRTAGDAFVGSVAGGVDIATKERTHPSEFLLGTTLGALVGVVAAPVAAVGAEGRALFHNARLGYKPRHLACRVTYKGASGPEVLILETSGWEVIKAMRPMSEADVKVPGALQREEAEALATVVVTRLEQVHHWPRNPRSPEAAAGQP